MRAVVLGSLLMFVACSSSSTADSVPDESDVVSTADTVGAATDSLDEDVSVSDVAVDLSEDALSDTGQTDVEDVPEVGDCGDGICAPAETADDCPADCGGGAATSCLKEQCPDAMAGCYDDDDCEALLVCLIACDDALCTQQCYVASSDTGIELMVAAVGCGQEAGCFSEPERCGNGVCESDETASSCPADCTGNCIEDNCAAELTQCEATGGCPDILACWTMCSDDACRAACYQTATPQAIKWMQAVEACALGSGCFLSCGDGMCSTDETEKSCPADCAAGTECGNDTCEEGETVANCPADCGGNGPDCGNGDCEAGEDVTCPSDCGEVMGSCEGKCGQFNAGATCQCDQQCVGIGDCCPDIETVCGDSPTTDCGNGDCEDGENASDCPGDCADLDTAACILAGCEDEVNQCAPASPCLGALQCLAQCDDSLACANDCGDALGRSDVALWSSVTGCGVDKGCLKP